MALPDDRTDAWPPARWACDAKLIEESRLWLVGDLARLGEFYASARTGTSANPSMWRKMLQRMKRGQQSGAPQAVDRVHNPIARKIARTSSMLLFSESPAFRIDAAHIEQDDDTATPDVSDAQATEDRLSWLAARDGWSSKLQQAATVSSGTGGVYLRPLWNRSLVADRPILTVVHHDHAVPTFDQDQLVEVIFWTEIERALDGTVWRWLERHTAGQVEHALYAGRADRIGERYPLAAKQRTKALIGPEGCDERGIVDLVAMFGIESVLADYVPNVLPHPVTLSPTIGGADTSGLEDQMTALDSADTGWAKDVDLGRRRIIVPDSFLNHETRGTPDWFDEGRDVFSPMSFGALSEGQETITSIDFQIRAADFEATITSRENRISVAAGYNPESILWANTGDAMTATEVLARDKLSADTTAAKQRFFEVALSSMAHKMLVIDARLFGSGVNPMVPSIEWPSTAQSDMREAATTLNLLNLAKAVSTPAKVRLLHPDWTQRQVDEEAAAILAEEGVQVDDPMGGMA